MLVEIKNIDFQDYKFVIAGSGPAAISLALGLKKKTKEKILILEAGNFEFDDESQTHYEGKSVNNCGLGNLDERRIRAFGGTTMVWGGMCRPLDKQDYKSWPINKSELMPYTENAYKFLKVRKTIKSDLNLNENFNLIDFKWSEPKLNINEDYKDYLIKDKQLDLLIETAVLSIDGTNKVEHVEVYNSNLKRYYKFIPRIFILACGAVENSRILLTSKYKSNKGFLKNLEIGTEFQIHPKIEVGKSIVTMDEIKNKFNLDYFNFDRETFYIAPTEKLISEERIGNVGCRILINKYSQKHKELLKELLCVAPTYANKILSLINENVDCAQIRFLCLFENERLRENRVSLDFQNLDTHGNPKAKLTMNLNENDKRTIRIFMEHLGKYFIDQNLGRIGVGEFYYNDKLQWDEVGQGGSHQMGGTRMGIGPNDSVVDKNLKIHNVNNFYVLGSSVFPSSGHANPTLTICQLAFRLSKHLTSIT